jgi:hypothetical protein
MNKFLILCCHVTALIELGAVTARGAEPVTDGDVYADTWVATDALGRVLPTYAEVGPPRPKQVGIFYFLWVNKEVTNGGDGPVWDNTRILAKNAGRPKWGPLNAFHFWGEPELGYYTIDDPFVITRHMAMLTAAQIDTLIFDQTNAFVYPHQMLAVCSVLDSGRLQGLPVPKVMAIHNSFPERSVPELYKVLYEAKKYPELWFRWLGKPLLLTPPENIPAPLKDYFTIRHTWAWTDPKGWFGDGHDKWTWVDWTPQQPGWHESADKPEEISVCVAPHPVDGKGRSCHGGATRIQPPGNQLETNAGLYVAEQWKRALEVDPQFILVTGWNEWIAQRFERGDDGPTWRGYRKLAKGDSFFVDQYTQEFSRDIEPMKGGHGDNYYYQLVANVRRYKGVRPPPLPFARPITIDGAFNDWNEVRPTYRDFAGDTRHRDHQGWNSSLRYINNTGRNDIVKAKVSHDNTSVSFHVQTTKPLTSRKDPNWMLLFLDIDQDHKTGWEGYDYVVNLGVSSETRTTLRRNLDGGWKWSQGRPIEYRVHDNQMEISIPRAELGLVAKPVRLDFHWADNVRKEGDINEFSLSGDSAPDRRFNYRYDATLTAKRIQEWTEAYAKARLIKGKP